LASAPLSLAGTPLPAASALLPVASAPFLLASFSLEMAGGFCSEISEKSPFFFLNVIENYRKKKK
jgi:hypothetical protein